MSACSTCLKIEMFDRNVGQILDSWPSLCESLHWFLIIFRPELWLDHSSPSICFSIVAVAECLESNLEPTLWSLFLFLSNRFSFFLYEAEFKFPAFPLLFFSPPCNHLISFSKILHTNTPFMVMWKKIFFLTANVLKTEAQLIGLDLERHTCLCQVYVVSESNRDPKNRYQIAGRLKICISRSSI